MSADTPTAPSPNAMCLILQYYRLKKPGVTLTISTNINDHQSYVQ